MKSVIIVEGLSKKYRIGKREPYQYLRDIILERVRKFFSFGRDDKGKDEQYIWALKDVSFEVKEGEVVGIIGRNGAGKSTLLKILSKITYPTKGYAIVRGSIGSMLEVGIGFHPELTGRENIFLYGTILGMKRKEIERKFDQIVEFSGLSDFIDTPVKYYSSGMYVRLAFATAAHLQTDILLVDEVLAVGDAEFQKRCLNKMGEVKKEGRTVLFVSHNIPAILNLCPRAILLDAGKIILDGPANYVIDKYLQTSSEITKIPLSQRTDRKGNQKLRFVDFQLLNGKGEPISQAVSGEDLIIALKYESANEKPLKNVHVDISIYGIYDESLFLLSTYVSGGDFKEIPQSGTIICYIPRLPLQPRRYNFGVFCKVENEIADWVQWAGAIDVEPGDFFGSGKLPPISQGVFLVRHSWDVISE
jgi:lipopolysaccharide transport system ATP-binding protein